MTPVAQRAVGALSERNFRLLFVGQSVSSLGSARVPVALAFAVLDLTHSPADLGYVLGAEAVAQVVCLLAGGVIADRLSRRAVMLAADSAVFASSPTKSRQTPRRRHRRQHLTMVNWRRPAINSAPSGPAAHSSISDSNLR